MKLFVNPYVFVVFLIPEFSSRSDDKCTGAYRMEQTSVTFQQCI